MTQTLQKKILARALALISEKQRWTTGSMARKSDGSNCHWGHPQAYKYCAMGAIARAAADVLGPDYRAAIINRVASYLLVVTGRPEGLGFINDREGHAAVVEMFEKALAA